MEPKELEVEIKKMSDLVEKIKTDSEKKSQDLSAAMEAKLAEKVKEVEGKGYVSQDEIKAFRKEMQDQYDEMATKSKEAGKKEVKTLEVAIAEQVEGKGDEIAKALNTKSGNFRMEFPEMKTMLLNGALTGDPVATYSPRQAILPAQKVNLRDLIPAVNSETGLYVFYKETSTTNNIARQLEGSAKGENTYALTEVKIVNQYIAGYTTFSKQIATSLPWLQSTLPRLLMRDFYKKENGLFYQQVLEQASAISTAETDGVKKLLDAIASQMDDNYDVSFIAVTYSDLAELIKSTYTNGYYPGAGTVNFTQAGLNIMGVPVIGASWATEGKALLIDNNFLERVQVKGLAIELSYENSDNFTKNLVTARIECQEEINPMLAAAFAYVNI